MTASAFPTSATNPSTQFAELILRNNPPASQEGDVVRFHVESDNSGKNVEVRRRRR
jgi:hypothetical protein